VKEFALIVAGVVFVKIMLCCDGTTSFCILLLYSSYTHATGASFTLAVHTGIFFRTAKSIKRPAETYFLISSLNFVYPLTHFLPLKPNCFATSCASVAP
jgi:hypothetical protein